VPRLQAKWTESEVAAMPESIRWLWVEYWQMEKENNPFVIVRSGEISYSTWNGEYSTITEKTTTDYFEIAEDWLYYIMAYWAFYFDPDYYSSQTSYEQKEWVWIAQPINWVFTNTDRTQARAVGNGDLLRFMQIWWYPKGSQIVPLVAHSFTSWSNYVSWGLSVVRLW
jgi:hypothetical protein